MRGPLALLRMLVPTILFKPGLTIGDDDGAGIFSFNRDDWMWKIGKARCWHLIIRGDLKIPIKLGWQPGGLEH